MLLSVQRSKIFSEFTPNEQKYWFSIKEKAVSHHVDTLYYSVFLKDDTKDNKNTDINQLINELKNLKQSALEVQATSNEGVVSFYELKVYSFGGSGGIFGFRLGLDENYDIFFAGTLLNDDTPRIQVQLRTSLLVKEGVYRAIEKSYEHLLRILEDYNISVNYVLENRIDYAFHTNALQKPSETFDDANLSKHLDTTFRDGSKHFYLKASRDELIDLDYLALGNRKSNNIFFRAYEKGKEVVQKNYKGFFFERWFRRGLISRFDKFCYEEAYKLGSYKTGLLVGRIRWYLENGSDPDLKSHLISVLDSCYVNSDNNAHIEREIKGIIPPVTLIFNCEFETKREFYRRSDASLNKYYDSNFTGYEPLRRLHSILMQRRKIINRLTNDVVCFREDRREPDSAKLDFWKRISRCKFESEPNLDDSKLLYSYSRKLDAQRTKNRALNSIASFNIIKKNSIVLSKLSEDFWDFITTINDNDLAGVSFPEFDSLEYRQLRRRRGRILKGLLDNPERPDDEDS